jgi:2-haloacid dehalogenase
MAAWVTFDCFGTLVDWHSGFRSSVAPFARDRTADLIEAYHRFERIVESEKPHRLYGDVLDVSLERAAREVGITLSDADARALTESWALLPVFTDVEPMLAELRSSGFRTGVLTNCDSGLFAQTERAFAAPFDMVITAEAVQDYKPSLTHFRTFQERARPDDWIHVACSWYHDIVPAHALAIRSVWLDRDRTGDDPSMASVRVESAHDVATAIARIL